MNKYLACLLLSFSSLLFSTPLQDRKLSSETVSELALNLGIDPGANLIEQTQKKWLRSPSAERWQIEELSAERKAFVLDWAERQGLFADWVPTEVFYDKAVIFGANTGSMQKRLTYLKQLWEEGIRFEEVVWLTGERPLDPHIDQLMDGCDNEAQAAEVLWKESALPEEMKQLPVVFIAVPMKKEGDSLKRPNTEDTIIDWVNKYPKPCSALFISAQPFCGRQFAVTKGILPESFRFDVVGKGVDPSSHPAAAAIMLDEIARWIYQEHKNSLSR